MIKKLLLCFSSALFVINTFSQNPVAENGQLQVIGHQLCNEQRKPIQLRGMSLFGLMHMPECLTFNSFKALKEDWNSNVIRIPVYVANYTNTRNYNQNPDWNNAMIDSTLNWAEKLGLYIIIDYHNDRYGSPDDSNHKGADAFFKLMSTKYAGKKNIIYEIFNEPYGKLITWDTIANYANRIVPVIRKNDPKAIILIGTPDWDQKLETIDTKKLNDIYNVMFTFHFYAASHKSLYPMFANQIHRIPVFVSEWGTCESSGIGNLDFTTSSLFLNSMKQHIQDKDTVIVSWCNFSYGDKAESTSALKPISCSNGLWNNTSAGGDFIKYWLINNKAPISWSVLVAQNFIKRFPNPDTMYCCGNTNHFSWQAGYVMFAMGKIWKATGDPLYYNYIKRFVDQQVDEKGNIPDFKDNALDNFLPGYAILFMYEQTHLEKYKIAAMKIRAGFDKYPRNSNGLFWHGEWATNQTWVDGLFMGQIFLARYGKTIGDSEYAFNEVVKQITTVAEVCQKKNGLLWHGWDESKKASWANKTTGLAPEVWSEGLGWYAVLLADIFDYLPKDHPGYPQILSILQKLCNGLKVNQDTKTGMWCQVVDKPNESGNWNETSGTGMYIYLLKRSIDRGFLPPEEYNPVIMKAYAGMIKKAKTNDRGFIDLIDCSSIGIQNSTSDYFNSPKEVSPFGAFGSFIIATSVLEFIK